MPIDPNIVLGVRQPQFQQEDPLNNYAKIMAIQSGQGQQQLQGLQIRKATEDMADDQAIKAAYQQSGGDSAVLRKLLQSGGNYKAIQALDKFELDKREKESGIAKNTGQAASSNATALKTQLEVHRDQLTRVDTPQAAAQWLASAYKDPVLSPVVSRSGSLEQAVSSIPQDPAEFQKWKVANGLGLEKFLNLQMDAAKLAETARGHTLTNTAAIRGQDLSAQTQRRGQDIGASTTIRGQNLTDTRERDVTLAGQKAQAGAAGRTLGEGAATAQMNLPQVTATADRAIKLVDDMIGTKGKVLQPGEKAVAPHPGFEGVVGATILPGARFIPGTSAADFDARLNEIKGGAFLQAFNSLKGGGQITEIEGKKATEAITRMERSQSEGEFVQAAREFQDVIRNGVKRAQAQAKGAPAPAGGIKFLGFE